MLIVFFFIPLLVLIILYLRIARNLVPAQSNDGDEQVIFFYHSQKKKIGAPYLPTILVNNTVSLTVFWKNVQTNPTFDFDSFLSFFIMGGMVNKNRVKN